MENNYRTEIIEILKEIREALRLGVIRFNSEERRVFRDQYGLPFNRYDVDYEATSRLQHLILSSFKVLSLKDPGLLEEELVQELVKILDILGNAKGDTGTVYFDKLTKAIEESPLLEDISLNIALENIELKRTVNNLKAQLLKTTGELHHMNNRNLVERVFNFNKEGFNGY